MLRKNEVFTRIKWMIAVLFCGIFAAVAVPKIASLMEAAKEGRVRANMHTLQLSVEDFAIQHGGRYPSSEIDMLGVRRLCPGGKYPVNPFTGQPSEVSVYYPEPYSAGTLGIMFPGKNQYLIMGVGRKTGVALPLQLKNY